LKNSGILKNEHLKKTNLETFISLKICNFYNRIFERIPFKKFGFDSLFLPASQDAGYRITL
jgi:hypothetical protein